VIPLGALLLATLQSGAASPAAAVDEALRLYWNGQYEQAVRTLSGACTEELPMGRRLECHQYLSFSHIALGDEEAAEREFMEMLSIDPGYRLDPELFSPKILDRFDASRKRLAKEVYAEGKRAYFEEDFEKALALVEKALAIEPENELALEYRDLAKERLALSEAARESGSEASTADAAGAPTPPAPSGPEPDDNGVYRPTSEIRRPVLLERTNPRYPIEDRRRGTSGSVILSVVIGEDGRVREPKVVRSVSASMDRAALEAVRTWKYRPAMLDGAPVPVYGVITVNFEYKGP
jgi:TonB family protein